MRRCFCLLRSLNEPSAYGPPKLQYMEGGDLRKALSADELSARRLGWYGKGKSIALDVACGVAFLHSLNVVHRDIKSRNVRKPPPPPQNRSRVPVLPASRLLQAHKSLITCRTGVCSRRAPAETRCAGTQRRCQA
jgi:serine/threonine protein kinase